VVGRITLSSVVLGAWRNANLGYWVARDRGGRGYATEAVALAVRYAFEDAGLHRVQAAVMPRNAPSIRVLEKNRFRPEGLAARYLQIHRAWEDHLLFAVTREEWPPTPDATAAVRRGLDPGLGRRRRSRRRFIE